MISFYSHQVLQAVCICCEGTTLISFSHELDLNWKVIAHCQGLW